MKNSQVTFSSSAKIARTAELVTAIIFLPRYLISARLGSGASDTKEYFWLLSVVFQTSIHIMYTNKHKR